MHWNEIFTLFIAHWAHVEMLIYIERELKLLINYQLCMFATLLSSRDWIKRRHLKVPIGIQRGNLHFFQCGEFFIGSSNGPIILVCKLGINANAIVSLTICDDCSIDVHLYTTKMQLQPIRPSFSAECKMF